MPGTQRTDRTPDPRRLTTGTGRDILEDAIANLIAGPDDTTSQHTAADNDTTAAA